jgi:hypothetical protein
LEAALSEAGFDHAHPDPRLAWRAFRAFASVPVSVANDDLLFQCGTYDFTGESRFHWNLTRQFTHEEDGEYSGMEQLQLTILYEATPDLASVTTNIWSLDCGSVQEWFARVEALPAFQSILDRTPVGCEVFQENV